MPILSVIIPCYNNGNYLKVMIECCIRQSFHNWELIIVDDGSTDEITQQLVSEYTRRDDRIKFFIRDRLPKGSVVCRNIGFKESSGKYVMHLDADDLISDNCFKDRVAFLEDNPSCDYASFPAKSFFDNEILHISNAKADFGVPKGKHPLLYYFLRANYPFSVWCNIYRRSAIEDIQWDERVKIYTDFSYIVQCIFAKLKHEFSSSDKCDYFYRMFKKKSTNMCSSFIGNEKIKSTNYLFDKILSEIVEESNSNSYLNSFRTFILLHYKRLLQSKCIDELDGYQTMLGSWYEKPFIIRLKMVEYIVKAYKGNVNLLVEISLYLLFPSIRNLKSLIHTILSK